MPEVTAGEGGVELRDEIWRPQGGLYVMLVAWCYHSEQLHNAFSSNF